MSDQELKPRFGGIPFRAVADADLTSLDLRILAIIAGHDGFNKNRKGCYASHKRIAALAEAHYKSTARSIAKLIQNGYLDAQEQGQDGRLRVYRVIYNEGDHAAFRGDGRMHAPGRSLRSVTPSVTETDDKPVTEVVTDHPTTTDDRVAGVGNDPGSGSVTGADEIGNRNAPPIASNELKSNDEGSRIYSTESKEIKNRINLAEAPLSEEAQLVGDVHDPPTTVKADDVFNLVHRAARYRQRTRTGPATDGDAEIELAMKGDWQEPVELDDIRRRRDARPSDALMNTVICRKARGLR